MQKIKLSQIFLIFPVTSFIAFVLFIYLFVFTAKTNYLFVSAESGVSGFSHRGSGNFTSTIINKGGYGEVTEATAGTELNTNINIDFNLRPTIGLVVFGDTLPIIYAPDSPFFDRQTEINHLIKTSKFIYDGDVLSDLFQTVDEIGNPPVPDFEINGIILNFPVNQNIDFAVNSNTFGIQTSDSILLKNTLEDNIRVRLYGFVGGLDLTGNSYGSIILTPRGQELKPATDLTNTNFSNFGFAPFRIFGDLDQSTITPDSDRPGSYTASLSIKITYK